MKVEMKYEYIPLDYAEANDIEVYECGYNEWFSWAWILFVFC